MSKEVDQAYREGLNSKYIDKNPYFYDTPEYREWDYGRIDADLYQASIQNGHPKLVRILIAAVALVALIVGYEYIWL